MSNAAQAARHLRQFAEAGCLWIDPINKVKAAYVRGDIEIEEFERQVELFLSGRPVAWLLPGERVLPLHR